MRGLGIFVEALLTGLGALALLNELAERAKRPRVWTGQSKDRRAFLTMIAAILFAGVRTRLILVTNAKSRTAMALLREVDLNLVQIESLATNLARTADLSASQRLLASIADQLAVYGMRLTARRPKANWASESLGPREAGIVEEAVRGVSQEIKKWSSEGDERWDPYRLALLSANISHYHTRVKLLIDGYTS